MPQYFENKIGVSLLLVLLLLLLLLLFYSEAQVRMSEEKIYSRNLKLHFFLVENGVFLHLKYFNFSN